MLAALISVLALAGAPASTPVLCDPLLPPEKELGIAYPDVVFVAPDGSITLGPLTRISLGPLSCGGLLYASASASERAALRRLNRGVDFDKVLGVGLLVALHEANHVALNLTNECLVEKKTLSEVDRLIVRYADPGHAAAASAAAARDDERLPPNYRGC